MGEMPALIAPATSHLKLSPANHIESLGQYLRQKRGEKEAKKGALEYVKIFNSHIGNQCYLKGSPWILLRSYSFCVKV